MSTLLHAVQYILFLAMHIVKFCYDLVVSEVTESFYKIELKFLNSRVLAGGFVLGCEKSLSFKHI